jgi:hypothetical protein
MPSAISSTVIPVTPFTAIRTRPAWENSNQRCQPWRERFESLAP